MKWGNYIGLSGWVLNAITSILLREMQREIQSKHTEDKVLWRSTNERFEDDGLGDWTEVSTSQEMLGATGNRVKEEILLEETLEGAQSWEHLDFSWVILISDFSNCERWCFCCFKPPGLW